MTTSTDTDTERPPGALMAAEIAERPAALQRLLDDGLPTLRAVAAEVAHQRPRRAVRQVPDRDRARPARRARLALHAHHLREPPGLRRRAVGHGLPVRRVAGPGGLHRRRPGPGRADAGGD